MSSTPFMPLWVSDFLGDTLDLDAAEIGAYMLLLMAQWNRDGGSLPNDPKKLQRVARCGRNWPKIWANVERHFSEDENGVYNKRLRLEAQNVAAKREVNAHNGAIGGHAKALKYNNVGLANATNSPKRNSSIPEPEPELDKRDTNVSPKNKPKKMRIPDDWRPQAEGISYAIEQGIPERLVQDEISGFISYWADRTDRDGLKSERGWFQCWQGHCRRIGPRMRKDSQMAVRSFPNGRGQGGGIASIAARRQLAGEV